MSRTSFRIVAISAFTALGCATIGMSAVSALPLNTTAIDAATAAGSLVTDAAEFYIGNGRCYMLGRKFSRPMPMSKCAGVQQRPPAH
jgi:hypothetical protein